MYFKVSVKDNELVSSKGGSHIWRNDCFEIFVDPTGKGLKWGSPRYFQIGLSPKEDLSGIKSWAWFQDQDPVKKGNVAAEIKKLGDGYEIYGKIKWDFVDIKAKKGRVISLSPAFHDKDRDGTEKKYNWCFISKDSKFELGKLILK